jgi:hypothetical protein
MNIEENKKPSTQPNIIRLCPTCGKEVREHHKDDIQQWYVCENGHQTSHPIEKKLDEMEAFQKEFCERIEQTDKELMAIAQNPNLLTYIFTDLNRRIKFDKTTKTSVFFSGLSAYLPHPLNLFTKGASGIGKSYNATETLEYFSESDVWFLGGMSPKTIVHLHGKLLDKNGVEITSNDVPEKPKKGDYGGIEEFKEANIAYKQQRKEFTERMRESYHYINVAHKIFVFLESPDFETMRMLYPILSHDKQKTEYRFVELKTLRSIKVVVEGWPSAIFLTTDKKYIEELATRSFTVSPEENPEKIEAANKLTNLKASLPWECELKTKEFLMVKALIEHIKNQVSAKNIDVIVPFLNLDKLFPQTIVRDMRDFQHFIQFLKAFTILHLYQRPCLNMNDKKYVLSSAQDIVNSHSIFKELFETTRTNTEQRILTFYYEFMKGKTECRVSDLTTEYNKSGKRRLSDFTIRNYLERLNEIGYVEKRESPSDKRVNLYIPLVKEKQELLDKACDSEKQIDLATVLKNSYEMWKTNICKTQASYTKNIFEDQILTLTELEPFILGNEKIISVFDTPLFKYPDKAETEQETENKPKNVCGLQTQAIPNNKKVTVRRLSPNEPHQCLNYPYCAIEAIYEVRDLEADQTYFLCESDYQKTIRYYKEHGYEVCFSKDGVSE